jgi:hypothetical protein
MKQHYNRQKYNAIHIRNIEWHFTFESWLAWWGDDIVNRGSRKGQLVMARNGDTGPYHPDNVRKATVSENCSEGNKGISKNKGRIATNLGIPHTKETCEKMKIKALARPKLICVHCNKTSLPGNAKRWHFDNCKEKQQ